MVMKRNFDVVVVVAAAAVAAVYVVAVAVGDAVAAAVAAVDVVVVGKRDCLRVALVVCRVEDCYRPYYYSWPPRRGVLHCHQRQIEGGWHLRHHRRFHYLVNATSLYVGIRKREAAGAVNILIVMIAGF